ncbi:hypothetical protein Aperf_G00000014738 [Anoplocephala perfoliata]
MDRDDSSFVCKEIFAKEVIECSSQYGEDGRTAFVAENLCGPPTIYPNFEDSTRSCAFLNYGTRWESFPGSLERISGGPKTYSSTDYVDVFFECPLIVFQVKIYETFYPGAIVAIRACYRDQPPDNPVNARGMCWVTLWESPARINRSHLPAIDSDKSIVLADSVGTIHVGKARIFEPLLLCIPIVMTDLIRIEFDVRRCVYHTQIDAVQVKGFVPVDDRDERIRRKVAGHWRLNRKELECFLSLQEEANNKQRNDHPSPPRYVDDIPAQRLPLPSSSAESSSFPNSPFCPVSVAIERFPPSLTSAFMRQTTLSVRENPFENLASPFSRLPYVVLLEIFSYFDLPTLCRISPVCKAFQSLADETLSQLLSINLQAFWSTVTDTTLSVLSKRIRRPSRSEGDKLKGRCNRNERETAQYAKFCSFTGKGVARHTAIISGFSSSAIGRIRTTSINDSEEEVNDIFNSRLKRLDVSWCGNYHAISPSRFCQFLSDVGRNLVTLRLSSCQMVNDECLLQIINICGRLEELDLSSCRSITSGGFIPLGRLISLRWLNLYRTRIADAALLNLADLCQHLRHLDLGSCGAIEEADAVIARITNNNPHLESLVLWRCRNLTSAGVVRIAHHCPALLRIDLGWCTGIESEPSGCLRELVSRCRQLRVLSFAAIRSVTPADVDAIADCLNDTLVYLDLIGNPLLTRPCIDRLLDQCERLNYLDISHCPSISVFEGFLLRAKHNHCTIIFNHRSFITTPPFAEDADEPMDHFEFPQLPPPQRFPPLALPAPRLQG